MVVEVSPLSLEISCQRLPLPNSRWAIAHRLSPAWTVYTRSTVLLEPAEMVLASTQPYTVLDIVPKRKQDRKSVV